MTNGYGAMPDYSAQLPPADRWAVAAYIRALQLSQNAKESDVPSGREGRKSDGYRTAAGAAGKLSPVPGHWLPVHHVQALPPSGDGGGRSGGRLAMLRMQRIRRQGIQL